MPVLLDSGRAFTGGKNARLCLGLFRRLRLVFVPANSLARPMNVKMSAFILVILSDREDRVAGRPKEMFHAFINNLRRTVVAVNGQFSHNLFGRRPDRRRQLE